MKIERSSEKRCIDSSDDSIISKKLRCNMGDGPSWVPPHNPDTSQLTDSSFRSQPLTILVGKRQEKFFVHEPHISTSSEFSQNALNEDSNQTLERTITLPESNPRAFEIYLKWLYSGRFYILSPSDLTSPDSKAAILTDGEWTKWSDCYHLSHTLCDSDFADALIDMAIDKMSSDQAYYVEIARIIYPNSTAKSPHRKFAVDLAVHLWDKHDFRDLPKQNAPTEFLTDVLRCVGLLMRKDVVPEEDVQNFFDDLFAYDDPCKYHKHTRREKLCHKDKRDFVFEQTQ